MCNYVDLSKGKCKISLENCPYLYFCNKKMAYKESKAMPEDCPIKKRHEMPKGYNKVVFERHGDLYIEVDNYTVIIKNPFNYVPEYVKLSKNKQGKWYIKK